MRPSFNLYYINKIPYYENMVNCSENINIQTKKKKFIIRLI